MSDPGFDAKLPDTASPCPWNSPTSSPDNAWIDRNPTDQRLIGGFRLHVPLKQGTTGTVHAARDPNTGAWVAIKLFHPSPPVATVDPPDPWDFLLRSPHPNIVRLLAHACDHGQRYVVMELSRDGNLKQLLPPRRFLSLPLAIVIARQVLLALDHLHGHGWLHRDLKPTNLLLFPDHHVKLADFGLMYPLHAPPPPPMGAPGFMSPEQVMGLALDQRSDLFSLGVLLYRMTTGHHPFPGDSLAALLDHTLLHHPLEPCRLQPHLPVSLSRIIMQALEKRPGRRFRDAGEFLHALDACVTTAA
ncbi:MAG: serine/threonine protein kinase [Magnetococcales bacterium]|nr:serine/threonine protein kinase [Magnetococcales bacterium]